ncbi:energy transducer TonB [Flagellimonas zhangzhouensis]|uniref:Protein TonB n=1 Tax=Flagellimonas zhangzhouensis TaxID=1073328 RepID=A0A1H2WSZ9_9FLAO|nr:energy transducer TonB [Allomuricauda zhangzhouensis]SDQ24507.1 outer membrane transport energization protein TonB [Allomuricauda zhangzhouensis]SDW83762.1 protein TonB [Allomuricauda zhangzhouensis]
MKPKKNPNAEIGRNSSLYFMIGLTSVLFVTWQSLEVKFYEKETKVSEVVQLTDDLKEEVPITEMIKTPPPPPPPSAPEVIEIVEDVVEVEETVIQSTESSQETYIEDAVVSIDDVVVEEVEENIVVPFAVIENVPVFPGCEDLTSQADRKACFNQKVQEHIKNNFKYPPTALEMHITGRVYVQFVIDNQGRVTGIQKRGPDKLLETEAERIIASLPKVKPGEQRGKTVSVKYSIPINFIMDNDKDD